MKITSRDAVRLCAAPPATWTGALLYGADSGLVQERRQQLVSALLGADGNDMQLTRIDAAEARRSPADVDAALTTQGFFAGRPVVVVEGATDALARSLAPIVSSLSPDDGFLLVTADHLPARSKLRTLFETAESLAAIGLYPQTLSAIDIAEALATNGVETLSPQALAVLSSLAGEMDHGAFRKLLEVVELYALDRDSTIDAEEISRLAPVGLDGDMDALANLIADGDVGGIGPLLRRLSAAGAAPVGILIMLQRHFKGLLTAKTARNGIAALRPPPMGPRRDRMQRQIQTWTSPRLEQANRLLFEADRRIRSASPPPEFALVERTALRLAMMNSR